MNYTKSLIILLLIIVSSCKKEKIVESENQEATQLQNTAKLYRKIVISSGINNTNRKEYEGYVSQKNDTFWNQWRHYKNGAIDRTKSSFYELEVSGNKDDSILDGVIRFYSPADSIVESKINSREVTFSYLQRENDTLYYKEIKTDKNIIHFKYKDYDSLKFVGFISDLRFIKIESDPKKLLLNRVHFAVDSEIETNNTSIEFLK